MTHRRLIPILAGMFLATTVLAGCSSPDAPATSGADRDADLTVTQCMRDKGHDMPDDGGVALNGDTAGDPSFTSDLADCRAEHGVTGAADGSGATVLDMEKEVALAECMRDRGVADYPDPGGPLKPYEGAYLGAFDSAAPACEQQVYGTNGADGGMATTGVEP